MQRIDENTYIDDTLVTCAEYQLFIDEMYYEQGKYYQPDHWTSNQFPVGQAHEPILGVRQSDAVAFCEWLTLRENGEWGYRLPTQRDVSQFPMKKLGENLHGNWMLEAGKLSWISPIPDNARKIEPNIYPTIGSDLGFANNFANIFHINFEGSNPIDFDSEIANTLDRARNQALAIDNSIDLIRIRAITLKVDIPALARTITSALEIVHTRSIDKVKDPERARALVFTLIVALLYAHTHSLNNEIVLAINMYIDLFTLQERIAGRSPAFEGIRLVKERIR